MKKLDESKVRWIITQKRKGAITNHVAQTMDVSARWVKKLWARCKHTDADKILYPARTGRPENGLPGRREHSAVLSVRYREHLGAAGMQNGIRDSTGINIPYSATHKILRDGHPGSQRRARDGSGSATSAPTPTPCGTRTSSC